MAKQNEPRRGLRHRKNIDAEPRQDKKYLSRPTGGGEVIMFGKTNVFEFSVGGMSCAHCKAAVEKALLTVAGVKSAKVDLAAKSVKVKGRAEVTLEALKEAVRGAGYEA